MSREWGRTVERGVWCLWWVLVRKQRTGVNRRELEDGAERAVFLLADRQGSPRLGEESVRRGICRPGFVFLLITSQLCD